MKVNFSKELVDLNGKAINDTTGKPATLKGVSIDALMAVFQDEQNLSGEEKLKRYKLAVKISSGESEVSVEEISMVKKLIGKAFGALVVGQCWEILEGK